MNASYRDAFGKDFPARATVGAGLMGADAAVEIMLTGCQELGIGNLEFRIRREP